MSLASPLMPSTAVVTGAGKRIGRAIALSLAGAGWSVAVHCRNSRKAAGDLAAEINSRGGKADVFCADLADFRSLDPLLASAADRLGPVTCLINNASEFLPDSIESMDQATWDAHLDINLKAPVFLAQSMVHRLPSGAKANIINIIDQRVWKLTPDFFSYTISKAGLWTATKTLAQGLAPNVRVNAIAPGPILQSAHQTEAEFAAEVRSTLLQASPTPDDIAAAVQFILRTPSMTGQMIALDGGQHLS
jgi:NAD(P)-dependent dehydrogenase (short-subunit alcohol dehydrogenase family)